MEIQAYIKSTHVSLLLCQKLGNLVPWNLWKIIRITGQQILGNDCAMSAFSTDSNIVVISDVFEKINLYVT